MRRKMTARARSADGFTLVELLVVIAILGILAAIVVFAVGGIGDKGEDAADKTSCSTLHSAEEAYFVKHGGYAVDPGAQDALKAGGYLHTTNPAFAITTDGTVGYKVTGPSCAE